TPAAAACSCAIGQRSYPAMPSGKPGTPSIFSMPTKCPPIMAPVRRAVRRPRRAAVSAAVKPANPAPTTATSYASLLTYPRRVVCAAVTFASRADRLMHHTKADCAPPSESALAIELAPGVDRVSGNLLGVSSGTEPRIATADHLEVRLRLSTKDDN